jgi:hypothetical protein
MELAQGLCPVVGFDISGVEASHPATIVLAVCTHILVSSLLALVGSCY